MRFCISTAMLIVPALLLQGCPETPLPPIPTGPTELEGMWQNVRVDDENYFPPLTVETTMEFTGNVAVLTVVYVSPDENAQASLAYQWEANFEILRRTASDWLDFSNRKQNARPTDEELRAFFEYTTGEALTDPELDVYRITTALPGQYYLNPSGDTPFQLQGNILHLYPGFSVGELELTAIIQ